MNCFNERRNESNIKKNATQKNAVHQELTLDARARVGALFVFVFVYRRCIGITGWVLVAPLPSPSGGCGSSRLPGCPIAGCGSVISAYHTGCPLSSGDTDLLYITSLLIYRYTG